MQAAALACNMPTPSARGWRALERGTGLQAQLTEDGGGRAEARESGLQHVGPNKGGEQQRFELGEDLFDRIEVGDGNITFAFRPSLPYLALGGASGTAPPGTGISKAFVIMATNV